MGSREPKGSGLQYSKNDRLEPKRSGRYLLLLALNPPASAEALRNGVGDGCATRGPGQRVPAKGVGPSVFEK
jgi:hypothetical protein